MELAATAVPADGSYGQESVMPASAAPSRRVAGLVAVGGLLGSALRVGLFELIPADGFPWSTIAVNLFGAALIGVILPRLRGRRDAMAFWVVGVGGAATTFSALTVDVVTLLESGRAGAAVGYLVASLVGGFAVASGAVRAGRRR